MRSFRQIVTWLIVVSIVVPPLRADAGNRQTNFHACSLTMNQKKFGEEALMLAFFGTLNPLLRKAKTWVTDQWEQVFMPVPALAGIPNDVSKDFAETLHRKYSKKKKDRGPSIKPKPGSL